MVFGKVFSYSILEHRDEEDFDGYVPLFVNFTRVVRFAMLGEKKRVLRHSRQNKKK